MHTGSDILDIDVFLNASEILFSAAKEFKNLEFIDFEAGLRFLIKKVIWRQTLRNLGKNYPPDLQIFAKITEKNLIYFF